MIRALNKFYNNFKIENRLLNMSINALIGYLIVEIIALLARSRGLTAMPYGDIFVLASIVNGATIIFIIILAVFRNLPEKQIKLIFYCEFIIFVIAYSVGLLELYEFRSIGLVFALVAVTIELPFASVKEIIIISLGAAIAQIAVSYYGVTVLKQEGSFIQAIFYTIILFPILAILSYISLQINRHRKKINDDRELLIDMNDRLLEINSALEKTNSIAQMEIELASQVQRMILPPIPDNIRGWDIAMSFKPKFGVSGDFYDFYYKNGQLKGMSIFDVSGHGVSSSLVTMIVKPITYRIFNSMDDKNIGFIIESVNENVSHEISLLDHFISCILLRFNGNTVEYANAGHPSLMFKGFNNGAAKAINTGKNSRGGPIGINIKKYQPAFTQFNMGINDTLLLYTDCIVESRNGTGEAFGYERLLSTLNQAPPAPAHDILKFILDSFLLFTQHVEVRDDFTVIVAKKTE